MSEAMDNAAGRAAGFLRLLDAMAHGGDAEAVRAAKPLIDDARPEDLVMAVDAAVARGDDFATLKPAVSRLVNLLSGSLKRRRDEARQGKPLKEGASPGGSAPDERFFASLEAENEGLERALERGKSLSKAINSKAGESAVAKEARREALVAMKALVDELGAVEIHYRKKENVLFPWFEARYPEYRCVRLMWEIQDDARRGLKELGGLLDEAMAGDHANFDPARLNQALGRLYFDLNANMIREEYALFPVISGLVGATEGERLFEQAREYGYAFLDAETAAEFEKRALADGAPTEAGTLSPSMAVAGAGLGRTVDNIQPATTSFSGKTGSLPNEVLAAMFSVLPVDMTWVDADDKVRWFSDSPHRIFPRSPAIVGRDVRNCHPGASVGRVVSIIESFRNGAKDREAFWITMGNRFIHIEYFALRSPEGAYLGVLEASQDITDPRALTGEKRLAD